MPKFRKTRINYKVKGYWSNESIIVHKPSFLSNSIEYYVKWQIGGRNFNEVKSELEANKNFAEALTHAVNKAGELTAQYQAKCGL